MKYFKSFSTTETILALSSLVNSSGLLISTSKKKETKKNVIFIGLNYLYPLISLRGAYSFQARSRGAFNGQGG